MYEHFNQIENWKCHMFSFRLISLDLITYIVGVAKVQCLGIRISVWHTITLYHQWRSFWLTKKQNKTKNTSCTSQSSCLFQCYKHPNVSYSNKMDEQTCPYMLHGCGWYEEEERCSGGNGWCVYMYIMNEEYWSFYSVQFLTIY